MRVGRRKLMAEGGLVLGEALEEAAVESSDITLTRGDLEDVLTAIQLSRRTYRTILQNLGWAFGYNLAAVPWLRSVC